MRFFDSVKQYMFLEDENYRKLVKEERYNEIKKEEFRMIGDGRF